MNHEFKLLKKEVIEAEGVINNPKEFGKELADIVIFAMSAARMSGIDLEKEIVDKIEFNKNRTYKEGTFRISGANN